MTMIQPAWDRLLERVNHIGGDIEADIAAVISRGPLAEITQDGDTVRFVQAWRAVHNQEKGYWLYQGGIFILSVSIDMVKPKDIGDDRFVLQVPFMGNFVFFPKHGNRLDRGKVSGLPRGYERLLALYPELTLDRAVALQVCRENDFLRPPRVLSSLPEGATVLDFLVKFRYDSTAEQFLWSYIEAMTGEKGIEEKVY